MNSFTETLSIQEYISQTGVVGLRVLLSATEMLVLDTDGVLYKAASVSELYEIVDAIEVLDVARCSA